jgi:hypothetical protein
MTTAPPTDSVEVSANHTTDGEQVVRVDSTAGSITVTIASSDLQAGNVIRVVDTGGNASANPITVQTEGSSPFRPSGSTSVQITADHAFLKAWCDGEEWYTERVLEVDDLVGENIVDESNATSGVAVKKDVSRDVDGNVSFAEVTKATLFTTTDTLVTTTASTTGRVVNSKVVAGFSAGSGNITIQRNGQTITSTSNIGTATALSATSIVEVDSPSWTLSADVTSYEFDNMYIPENYLTASGSTNFGTNVIDTSKVLTSFYVDGDTADYQETSYTVYCGYNSSIFATITQTSSASGFFTETTFDPTTVTQVTLKLHADGSGKVAFSAPPIVPTQPLKIIGNFTYATATFAAYRNEVQTVE